MRLLRALIGVVALMTISACDDRFPDIRYKMTIVADGKAFASVRRVTQDEIFSMQSSSGQTVKRTLSGEAVILDLHGRTYYALLTKRDNADYATMIPGAALAAAIPTNIPQTDMAAQSRAMSKIAGAYPLPRTLPPKPGYPVFKAWPMFVTFDDPSRPDSVREVSPDDIGISKITIEITTDEISTGIDRRLTWLPKYYDKMLDGSMFHNSDALANRLDAGAFTTGPMQ